MAVNNGQKGFWLKKKSDTAPVWVGLGTADTPDAQIEMSKKQFIDQINKSGAGVEWSGESPTDYNVSGGTITPNAPAGPDVVGDTYFDVMLKNIEKQSGESSRVSQQGFDSFLANLKRDRQLFNKDLERDYGKALEQINVQSYARGVGDSGIKTKGFDEAETTKDLTTEKRDVSDQQREIAARQDFENAEAMRKLGEQRQRASLKSPYANYQY